MYKYYKLLQYIMMKMNKKNENSWEVNEKTYRYIGNRYMLKDIEKRLINQSERLNKKMGTNIVNVCIER